MSRSLSLLPLLLLLHACGASRDEAPRPDAGSPAPTCSDGVKNGDETDLDCGGGCSPCEKDQACELGADCLSGHCVAEICSEATCSDGVKNGDESDLDCGGSCAPCGDEQGCRSGADCESGSCVSELCAAPSCEDGVKNGEETDLDCGGGCSACGNGKACEGGSDCQSGVCTGSICQAPACSDGVRNGEETDLDCGGGCAPCGDLKSCAEDLDCESGVCAESLCVGASCTDGVKNGEETDLDCGGGCAPCQDAQACAGAADCRSGVCTEELCQAPTCSDGVKNGDETDLDCGGGCAPCADLKVCGGGADCRSGVCAEGLCQAPTCEDRVRNGGEEGKDCGGSCEPCLDTASIALRCTFSLAAPSADCSTSTDFFGRTDAQNVSLIGGQNVALRLSAGAPSYADGRLSFAASVENLLAQALGTIDGVNADPQGLRLVLHEISLVSGTGAIEVLNADGVGDFATLDSPYFRVEGMVAPGASSEAKTVELSVPASVDSFTADFFVSAQVQARLVINEVLANPGGEITDSRGEWFELYNAGHFPVQMQGFKVGDIAASGDRPLHTIASPLLIEPEGYLVLGNSTNTTENGGAPVDYSYGAALTLANSLDAVRLVSPVNDTEMQRAGYSSAAISAKNGVSRELKNPALSNADIDGENWADAPESEVFGEGGRGTPGRRNGSYQPLE